MVSKKNLLGMDRRNFLRTLVTLGVSSSAVSAFTQAGLADVEFDPETEVPRIHGYRHTNHQEIVEEGARPRREPVYEVISREKWRLVESADDVRERVKRRLSDLDPTPQVSVRVPDGADDLDPRTVVVRHVSESDDRHGRRPSPKYSPTELADTVKDRFPDEMAGIAGRGTDAAARVEPIPLVTERVEIDRSSLNYYDCDYHSDGVPSGCVIRPDGSGGGTLGVYAFDGDIYSYVYVTAGHVVSGHTDVYQNNRGESGDLLASVFDEKVSTDRDFDVGLLWGTQIGGAWKFAADTCGDYHGPSIEGAQSRTGLLDMEGTNETVKRQGAATKQKQGEVTDVGDTWFETDADEANGDSGGPHWIEKSGDALISGIHQGEVGEILGEEYGSHATIMESIENNYNIFV